MKRNASIFLLIALVSFSACLKDDPINDYTEIKPIVIIPNSNWPKATAIAATTLTFGKTYSSKVYARVSWEQPLTKEVPITFVDAPGALTAHNAAFASTLTYLPADQYKVSSYTTTIPSGQSTSDVNFEIYPDKIDFFKDNAVAFIISAAGDQDISSNYKTIIVPVTARNVYDGVFATVKGRVEHPTNPAYTGTPDSVGLAFRTGAVSKNMFTNSHPWAKGSNATFPAGYEPVFTWDLVTNEAIITLPKISGTTPVNIPGYTTKYDAAKKMIYAAWQFNLPGQGDVKVFDTLLYKKAR
jgi:hypothetical protein